ncbi:protein kinase domain-containing protein [Paenibacillus thalictri]|uniref:Protein kinase domain-containing protein n=1 Tax=Paenibacillus thalictri TaxID=2527873 RepID=A0A4Q9DI34_9BACL|nr:hypothetical protein [Paenibacillus thalictri]TBL69771.1 hypothetical protein EYB31_34915 [Paenibacillus thalictri]
MKIVTSAIIGNGRAVYLGDELGRGGEGSVYEVKSDSTVVAKVYHQSISVLKQEKIKTMVGLKNESLLGFTTWPVDVLRNSNNQIIGFLMPRLAGKAIHSLYSPKTRLNEFPKATFPFLIHTAANLARAFATVHESGHVIGDVNHGNFYVTDKGTVMIVDCDSFQIVSHGTQYKCEVGIPMYQPPEFQSISSFRDVDRTYNHDNFGLAVFIFLLLFMGRHPFSGRYLGPGDMPIEKAIKEFRFAYSNSAAAKMMQPPPGTLTLKAMPSNIGTLFERAFSTEGTGQGRRPSAKEWVAALSSMADQIKRCPHKEEHSFPNILGSCPWCELEGKTGVVLFPTLVALSNQSLSTFRLETVWAQIVAVSSPGVAPALPIVSIKGINPSQTVVVQARTRKRKKYLSVVPSILGVTLLFLYPAGWIFIVLASFIFTIALRDSDGSQLKQELNQKYKEAEQAWNQLSTRWAREAGYEAFSKKMSELENARREYQGLVSQRNERIKKLESTQKNRQLYAYLQRFRIEDAKIEGIGPSRKATLESFGIETAADINVNAIRQVPGFGPSYTRKLSEWRNRVERNFVFDPKLGIPQSDIANVDREIAAKRKKLEQELLAGQSQLTQISNQIKVRRNAIWPELVNSANRLAQADVDRKAL